MSRLRSISTAFWSDPYIEELTASEKLLFIYLITNEKTNMLGIYEASISKMSFETSIPKETVSKALKRFESDNKVKYIGSFVCVTNYMKHQNYNPNMKKSAIDAYNNLPQHLKIEGVTIDKTDPLKAFETLSNCLGMVPKYEVEYEYEKEEEVKEEVKNAIPHISTFLDFAKVKCKELGYDYSSLEQSLKSKLSAWVENDWKDGNNKKILNWKSKLVNTIPFLAKSEPTKKKFVAPDYSHLVEKIG